MKLPSTLFDDSAPPASLAQPLARCVEHVIAILIRAIQGEEHQDDGLELTARQVDRFAEPLPRDP